METQKQGGSRVAIQGGYGAFHEIAARKYFNGTKLEIVPCDTFFDLFESIATSRADVAVVAIENSVAGSLIPNYALLSNSDIKVTGEVYLRIVQNLIALPGQTLDEIKEVHSHPMAILQCQEFLKPLRQKGVKVKESIDTALSAKWISDNKLGGVAALASDLAADMYGLEVLAESVESNKRNFTRFLIVEPGKVIDTGQSAIRANKSTICFTLPHQVGSLSQVLSVLAYYKINLSKIQSLPIVGQEWEYFFHLDVLYEDYNMYKKALSAIMPLIDQLQILGNYLQGQRT
jgi:prephenate dehydratase